MPSIYLKNEKGGACVFTSNKLVIVGVYSKDNQTAGKCNGDVEDLGEKMISVKYWF